MSIVYSPTPLELWVSDKYKKLKMLKPEDICEYKIARIYNIFYFKNPVPSNSFENGKFKSITIDSRIVPALQREQFYHEWCHILRHAGNQNMMPAAFRELQEYDARNFTRYAAIPYHMLNLYDLADPQLLDQWQSDFKISSELCNERLQKLKSKIKYRTVVSSL